MNVAAHRAHFEARDRSAAKPPVSRPCEPPRSTTNALVHDLERRLDATSDRATRECIALLIDSALTGRRLPRAPRVPTSQLSLADIGLDFGPEPDMGACERPTLAPPRLGRLADCDRAIERGAS